ncbi:MAG: 2,3,4,5-tetrahydropyridine-2,6-dicarboxylate N-acetyltransferase [Bacilli bacterium]|nr:2,3,4,5-tetrahydropyridine-2,6-dicarboxylate N-acetyltransferase [Bacilli bacterium]
MNTLEIINFIKNSKKSTHTIAYINGLLKNVDESLFLLRMDEASILVGELDLIKKVLEENKNNISSFYLELDRRNSKVPLLDYTKVNARIEPGAYIRDHVVIEDGAVIMMGAVINIGAKIGRDTMIDMNAVIGGRAEIGARCHIGAGSVIAGVIEPASSIPVIIEDDVLIGANAVVLEGVRVGKGAIVGAGSIVTKDVEANTIVVGSPARFVRFKDEIISKKSEIVEDLRK